MFKVRPPTRRSLTVTAIGSDVATIDGLGRYLERRVAYRAVFALGRAQVEWMASDCVVFYPDGFAPRPAQQFARRLIGSPTVSLVIIVTARPAEFRALERRSSPGNRLIVLTLPTWPWTLFATIESSLPSARRDSSRIC